MALRNGLGGDLEDVKQESGDEGEDEVDEEAVIGFEAKDASTDAEKGGSETVEVGESLGVVDHRLGDNGVDLELAFRRHCRGWR